MVRTSLSHPIGFGKLPVLNGHLALTFCPGKKGPSVYGADWDRDLDIDLAALRAAGATMLVTAMETKEFALLQVTDLPARVAAHGMAWAQLPIVDVSVPARAFDAVWPAVRAQMLQRLQAGELVVLHCRGGLGRTGTVAALLLIETGTEAREAVRQVRAVRPWAIETQEQEAFVLGYRAVWG